MNPVQITIVCVCVSVRECEFVRAFACMCVCVNLGVCVSLRVPVNVFYASLYVPVNVCSADDAVLLSYRITLNVLRPGPPLMSLKTLLLSWSLCESVLNWVKLLVVFKFKIDLSTH